MIARLTSSCLAAVGVAALGVASPVDAGVEPPEPPAAEGAEDSLIPVPPGCPVPVPADVAFVGTVLDKDGLIEKGTVRYQIDQIKAGDATPFSVRGVIDIRYGPDSKYLDIGEQYLVGASVDPSIGVLASKVSPDTPLFGGDAVIGLEDTAVECPTLDDPTITLNVDGSAVDSGLLTPLFADRTLLLATIGVPAAVVGLALVGLVLLRRLLELGFRGIFALGRQAVSAKPDHKVVRVRNHRDPEADDHADDLVGAGR